MKLLSEVLNEMRLRDFKGEVKDTGVHTIYVCTFSNDSHDSVVLLSNDGVFNGSKIFVGAKRRAGSSLNTMGDTMHNFLKSYYSYGKYIFDNLLKYNRDKFFIPDDEKTLIWIMSHLNDAVDTPKATNRIIRNLKKIYTDYEFEAIEKDEYLDKAKELDVFSK